MQWQGDFKLKKMAPHRVVLQSINCSIIRSYQLSKHGQLFVFFGPISGQLHTVPKDKGTVPYP